MLRVVFLFLIALFIALSAPSFSREAKGQSVTQGNYIVVLNDSVANPSAVAAQQARALGGQVGFVYKHALKGYSVTLPTSALPALEAHPLVRFVSEDTEMTAAAKPVCNDPFACQQLSRGIRRIDSELSSARSGNGRGSVNINVAVLDSGIDTDHPDLNVVGGVGCTGPGTNSFDDDNGHGTVVAGLIGAKDNSFGVVGVAPGARLWAVKVLSKHNFGADSKIICGIDWATSTRTDSDPANDIAIANMSLAGPALHGDDSNCGLTQNDPFHLAICNSTAAGVTYVVAAGNDSMDFAHTSPATYKEVLTATAISDTDGEPGGQGSSFSAACAVPDEVDDTAATFSNFATLPEDGAHAIAAPGACLGGTVLGGAYGGGFSGTSLSSPLVAGTVALCIASGPCAGLTPAQIIQKIVADAAAYNNANPGYGFVGDPLRPVEGKYYGYLIRAALY